MTKPSDRYLLLVAARGEAGALKKIRACPADLRVWRRHPDFREREQHAIAHPRPPARMISLASIGDDDQAAEQRAESVRDYIAQRWDVDALGRVKRWGRWER